MVRTRKKRRGKGRMRRGKKGDVRKEGKREGRGKGTGSRTTTMRRKMRGWHRSHGEKDVGVQSATNSSST